MKLKNCLTGFVLLVMNGYGQQIKPLTIGDAMPAIVIKGIFNYPALQSNTSAFKSKLLILDFMATNCGSCLQSLPRFTSLQKEYGDKIQILLITRQPSEKIKLFLQQHAAAKLPVVCSDSVLAKFFPHEFVSHEVWIYNGIVKAITSAEYVNAKNIETVVAGKKIDWPVKRDLAEFDYSKPLLLPDEKTIPVNSLPQSVFYTTLSTNLSDVPARLTVVKDSSNGTTRISIINKPIIDMYLDCLGKRDFPRSFIILDVKDSSRFIYNESEYRTAWKKQNTFCFEAIFPASVSEEKMMEKMRSDLDVYLGMHGRMEKRKVQCLIIVKSDTVATAIATQNKQLRKIPIRSVVYILNQNFSGIPVMDETGYAQRVFVQVDENDFTNIPGLRQVLKTYGLDIIPAEREVEMFLLTDHN